MIYQSTYKNELRLSEDLVHKLVYYVAYSHAVRII